MTCKFAIFSLFLSLTRGDVLRYGFPEQAAKESGNHWAVLVAGSSTWGNYRHQADVCHAYQILIEHGFHEDRIITMMYDDIAQNEENPTPGVIINHPDGPDVYKGVQIDYRGSDVNPAVFMAVLKGDAEAVRGQGTGRVLKSTASDHVFVNFVDHGGTGILGFPTEYITAKEVIQTIKYMHRNKMYNEMVMYIEACESGSIFEGILPDNINVYVTTAANPMESSYACYLDRKRNTYLGDVYSVKWMEDSDMENLKVETLYKQFKLVKKETNTSHVQQYGDTTIAKEDVAEFQGGKDYKQPQPQVLPKVKFDAVRSEDVRLSILQDRLMASTDEEEKERVQGHIDWIEQVRARTVSLMTSIVQLSSGGDNELTDFLMSARYRILDHDCYDPAVRAFHETCMRIPQNDYALRQLYVFANLCEAGIAPKTIIKSIHQACSGNLLM